MSAADNLSPTQFMGIDELKTLRAGDYPGETVGNLKHAMLGNSKEYPVTTAWIKDDVDHLASSIREHGVQRPLEVSHHTAEDGTTTSTLTNGHHRALAAMQAGVDRVPVTHVSTSAAQTEALRESLLRIIRA